MATNDRTSFQQKLKKLITHSGFWAALIGVIFFSTLIALVINVDQLQDAGILNPNMTPLQLLNVHHARSHIVGPLQATDIQTWMTFNYLNKVFSLPPDYLMKKFNITDTAVPAAYYRAIYPGKGIEPNSFSGSSALGSKRIQEINYGIPS